ncbi:MAG: gliding motility lipoprotein GldD [Flavobacteriia bacterium]|nr:gliding motility lipoprotein GldD [Flavobacteriia bacterium]
MKIAKIAVLAVVTLIIASCGEEASPRPYAYPRIELPEQVYENAELDSVYPYNFEINENASWKPVRDGFGWIDIEYPSILATVQVTYKPVEDNLQQLTEEAHGLAYNHTVRADGIVPEAFRMPENEVYGILYRFKGDAATTTQFFLTDSTTHFLRGVVYFYAAPNADSLRPASNYMAEEVKHIMRTTQWNNK